jgi:regulator of nonsense transcripts 1
MDSFENFQNDSASSYGGMSIVDDTSSVYTVNTPSQPNIPVVDFDTLSLVDDRSVITSPSGHGHGRSSSRGGLDDDFDGVLDDLKDETQLDLPPHACR